MTLFAKKLQSRFAALFRKEKLDAEVDEELQTHIALRTDKNISEGLSQEEARTAAVKQFGWSESVKESVREQRGVSWIEHLFQDLRFGIRMLRKNWGFTLAAVVTLALGIGANTAIFSVINTVLLRPLPYAHPERLVTLWESGSESDLNQRLVSGPNYLDWKEQNQCFEEMAVCPGWQGSTEFNLLLDDGVRKVHGTYASASFFTTLGVAPLLGRVFLPEEDQRHGNRVAILSWALWQREFEGDPNVLGKTLAVDTYGRRDYTIVGVMPAGFGEPGKCDLWLPLGWMGVTLTERRGSHWHTVLARLKPGVSLEQVRVELNTIQSHIRQEHPGEVVGTEVAVIPLLEQALGRKMKLGLFILWGVAGGVLLIACVNVANLMLVRAAAREKEIAVRLALGAARSRIISQLLVESITLGLVGGAAGLVLAYWLIRVLIGMGSADVPRVNEVTIDFAALAFTLLISVLTGALFGLAPALQFSRPDLGTGLKEGGPAQSSGVRGAKIRDVLVIAEMALSVVLLIGAGLMLQSFARLMQTNRGLKPEHLLIADLDFSVSGFTTWVRPTATRPQVPLQRVIENLQHYPGVEAIGASSALPRRDRMPPNQTFAVFGRPLLPADQRPSAEQKGITPDYLRALGVPLLRGRWFTEADDLLGPGVALVSETFAERVFPNEDPIGKFITMNDGSGPIDGKDQHGIALWAEIVGVVGDVKTLTPEPLAVADIYRPYWQWPMQSPTLAIRANGDPGELARAIRQEVKRTIPQLPVPNVRTMDQLLNEILVQSRFETYLLVAFGALALFLAAIGLYGVLAYLVRQRAHEIGIRMALGAQKRDAIWLIIRQGMQLTFVGVGVGLLGAFALTRVMRSLLYEVHPTDPATFGGVVLVLLLVALFASWFPARKAAEVNPMTALRCE